MYLKKILFIFLLVAISFVVGAASYKHKKYLSIFKDYIYKNDHSYTIKSQLKKIDFISNENFQLVDYFIPEEQLNIDTMYLSLFLQKYDINLLTGDDKKSKGGICIVNNKLIVVNGSMELVIIDNKNKEFLTSKKLNFYDFDLNNLKVNDVLCNRLSVNKDKIEIIISLDQKFENEKHKSYLIAYNYDLSNNVFTTKKIFESNLTSENNAGRVVSKNFKKFYLSFSSDQHDLNKSEFDTYPSQDLKNNILSGKVLEIDSIKNSYKVFSYGHRNPQGLYFYEDNIYSTEHGPKGGDELNILIDGSNYGWPLSSTGSDYNSYEPIYGELGRHSRFTKPIYSWNPGIGISNLIALNNFHDAWNNDLIISSLKTRSLYRVRLNESGYVSSVENIFIGHRIRDIIQHDNEIILWTDDKKIIFIKNTLFPIDKKWVDVRDPIISYCFTCHHLGETNQTSLAPTLLNIFSKNVGSDPSYNYSSALKNQKFKWNELNLKEYLLDPQKFLPGTLKKFNLKTEQEANKIIEILKKVSVPQ